MKSAVVLVIDGLGAGWLGPYGNTWIDTPSLNHLAAQSQLIEFAITDSRSPLTVLDSILSGRHAACRQDEGAIRLPDQLPAGTASIFLTDDAQVARQWSGVSAFQQAIVTPDTDTGTVETEEATSLGRLFGEIATLLESLTTPYFLLIHSRGLYGPWDAPYALRASLADPEDPAPPKFTVPPKGPLEKGVDPDQLLGYRFSAGGQILLLDACLDALLHQIDGLPAARRPLLAVTAPRGFPLGEHGVVGAEESGLYAELVAVPLMFRIPGQEDQALRHPQLAQPYLLTSVLAQWLQVNGAHDHCLPVGEGAIPAALPLAAIVAPDELRLDTRFWCSRMPQGTRLAELYVKPDDRWEVNNVAALVTDVAASMEQLAGALRAGDLHRFHSGQWELPEAVLRPPE